MNADANRRLENIVRFGTVKTINPSKPIPRVIVNLGDIETPEIRCLNIRSGGDATWDMPSINEECVVISPCFLNGVCRHEHRCFFCSVK